MSADAIFATTMALRRRIADAAGAAVHIGPPLRGELGSANIALFLFHLEPSAELRNLRRMRPAPQGSAIADALVAVDALPLELHFLVSCFRPSNPAGGATDPTELQAMGRIMQGLHLNPVLTGAALPGQEVRVTPASYTMQQMNHLWELFPQEPYRTSFAYLATPVFVEADAASRYPAVQSRRIAGGLSGEAA